MPGVRRFGVDNHQQAVGAGGAPEPCDDDAEGVRITRLDRWQELEAGVSETGALGSEAGAHSRLRQRRSGCCEQATIGSHDPDTGCGKEAECVRLGEMVQESVRGLGALHRAQAAQVRPFVAHIAGNVAKVSGEYAGDRVGAGQALLVYQCRRLLDGFESDDGDAGEDQQEPQRHVEHDSLLEANCRAPACQQSRHPL